MNPLRLKTHFPIGRRNLLLTATRALGLGAVFGAVGSRAEGAPLAEIPSAHKWDEMSASDLQAALERKSLVYVPIGTLEFHGPHLPLATDAIHAYEFCLAAAARTGGVVLPPSHWSPHGHEKWAGSILVREETFRALMTDVFTRLAEQDVKWVVACTGHFPSKQEPAIRTIAATVMERFPKTRIIVLGPWCHPTDPSADHGGKKETDLMLALRPKLVHMERLKDPDAFRGIGKSAVEGTARSGREHFDAEVENFVGLLAKTMAGAE
ncbi:MAG: creatininase family protein [Verrucomicrobia bacterium]|nr:creatininase family protein [Verrucomicrobiota bacterium]